MPVTRDIPATYRGPGTVVRRLVAPGEREDKALAYLMAGCVLMFVAQLPRLAREAHLTGQELNGLLSGALLGWIFIAPLMLYLMAAIGHLVAKPFGGKGSHFGARIALFWALLAASPLFLLNGLVAGFVGPGLEMKLVGTLWLGVFLWFWIGGLIGAEKGGL